MNFSNQLLFFFSALGAFNGFILAIYCAVIAKREKFSNYFLAWLLLTLSIRIMKSVFFYFNPELANIFIQIGLSACILIGPFLFLYLKAYLKNEKGNWGIHVIPWLAGITILGIVYPYLKHSDIWSSWIVRGIYFQWLFYIAFSFKYLQPTIKKISAKEALKNIDIWLLSIYFGVLFIWLAYSIGAYASYIVGALSFSFVLYLVVLLFVFKSKKESGFFKEKEKYRNKEIEQDTLEQIRQGLSKVVEEELYLNPALTLDDMAKEIRVSKHQLSQFLNEKLGKSFSALINEYRIEKAKSLLQTEKDYTVESLGYDSGFNSKSTFFTTFKKLTGKTPAEYQKSHTK